MSHSTYKTLEIEYKLTKHTYEWLAKKATIKGIKIEEPGYYFEIMAEKGSYAMFRCSIHKGRILTYCGGPLIRVI